MGVIVQDVFYTVTNSLGAQCSLVDLFIIAVLVNSCCGGFSPGAFIAIRTCFPQALWWGLWVLVKGMAVFDGTSCMLVEVVLLTSPHI